MIYHNLSLVNAGVYILDEAGEYQPMSFFFGGGVERGKCKRKREKSKEKGEKENERVKNGKWRKTRIS
jgi:hypothetical protein